MNLTFEVNETGYTIFNNGQAWITQDGFTPYPSATVEESAQNHINEILKVTDADANKKNDVEQLQEDSLFIAETLALALEEIEQLKTEISAVKGAQ